MRILAAFGVGSLFSVPAAMSEAVEKYGLPIALAYADQRAVWEASMRSPEVFLEENKARLKDISIGCSFAPERFDSDLSLASLPSTKGQIMQAKALDALQFMVEELGMRHIRVSIRWNNVVRDDGAFNFSLYKPYMDYLSENQVNPVVNIGPIKTFGLPEEPIPEFIKRSISLPPADAEITPEMPIAQVALEHMERVLTYLKKNYPTLTAFQPDNEPFNRFGPYPWRISYRQLLAEVNTIYQYFPNTDILINNSGAPSVTTASDFLPHLRYANRSTLIETADFLLSLEELQKGKGGFILGYDYYHWTPITPEILGQKIDSSAGVKILEGPDFVARLKRFPFGIEITEMQAEPWGREELKPKFPKPGNSAQEFQFALLRSLELLKEGQSSVIRVWGTEWFYNTINGPGRTAEHDKIIYLVQAINKMRN